MAGLRVVSVVVSALLLGAHFFRAGRLPLVALSLVVPLLLLTRRAWATWLVRAGLLLGAAEWLRTLVSVARARQATAEPWTRMALILAIVALFTAAAAVLVRTPRARRGAVSRASIARTGSPRR